VLLRRFCCRAVPILIPLLLPCRADPDTVFSSGEQDPKSAAEEGVECT